MHIGSLTVKRVKTAPLAAACLYIGANLQRGLDDPPYAELPAVRFGAKLL